MSRELSNDEYPISKRAESQLIKRALRWNTTDEVKDLAIEKTREHIESDNERVSAAGIRNLIAMEKMNQEDEKAKDESASGPDRWIVIAQQLGLSGLIKSDESGEADRDPEAADPESEAEGWEEE